LEQASSVIRTYQPHTVPELLQSRDVARALIQLNHPNASADDIDRRVTLRLTRQQVLIQPAAPNLWAVIDESALWRSDRRSAMRAQIQHLIEMTKLPNITLQVLPTARAPTRQWKAPSRSSGSPNPTCPILSTLNTSPARCISIRSRMWNITCWPWTGCASKPNHPPRQAHFSETPSTSFKTMRSCRQLLCHAVLVSTSFMSIFVYYRRHIGGSAGLLESRA